jgi:hypothetical protein
MTRLDPTDIELIARCVVELLREHSEVDQAEAALDTTEWLSTAEAAELTGMSRDWIYRNQVKLGVKQMGDGPKPRLRFSRFKVEAAFHQGEVARPDPRAKPSRSDPKPRRRKTTRLLEVRGTAPYAAFGTKAAPGGADTPTEGLDTGGGSSYAR